MQAYLLVFLLALVCFGFQLALGFMLVNSNGDNRAISVARIMLASTIIVLGWGHVPIVYVIVPLVAGFVGRHFAFLSKYGGYAGWKNTAVIHLASYSIIVICGLLLLTKGLFLLS